MLRLVIAALLGTSVSAAAQEQSPWFGSAEMTAFRMELPQPSAGPDNSEPREMSVLACHVGDCPVPRKIAIDVQGLAAAP